MNHNISTPDTFILIMGKIPIDKLSQLSGVKLSKQ